MNFYKLLNRSLAKIETNTGEISQIFFTMKLMITTFPWNHFRRQLVL